MHAATLLVGLIAVVAVAGCGAGGPGTTGPTGAPGPTAAPGGASVPATANPTASGVSSPSVSTDAPEPSLPDPCSLVTQEEAAVAVAAPVSGGVEEGVGTPDLGSGRQCSFRGTGEGAAMIETFPNPAELYDVYKLQQGQFGKVTDLAGAGEKAFTVGNYECNVVKGDVIMVVTLAPGDGYKTDPEPRMVDLCLAASARL